jgi:hypothetical protein
MKEKIGKKAFEIFLWAIGKSANEYYTDIHRQQERIRKNNKRKQQRLIKQQNKLENHE